jgi:hypothetical protein
MLVLAIAAVMALAAADPPAGTNTDPSAIGQQTTNTPPPSDHAGKPPKGDPQEVICDEVPSIGSNIPRRLCATRAQWEKRAKHDQEELRRQNEQGRGISE